MCVLVSFRLAERLDSNGDGELSVEEFARNPNVVDRQADVQQALADGEYPGDWSETRANEFRAEVDVNGDGRASLQELIVRHRPVPFLLYLCAARFWLLVQGDRQRTVPVLYEWTISTGTAQPGNLKSSCFGFGCFSFGFVTR